MFYTHGALDRCDALRKDPEAIAALRRQPDARLLPVWRGTALVTRDTSDGKAANRRIASLPPDTVIDGLDAPPDEIFLGLLDGAPWFALPVSALDDARREALARRATDPDGRAIDAEFADLRVVGPMLPANDGALLAFARGLAWWQETTRFCSRCAKPLVSTDGGHVRRCTDEEKPHSHFPRTDPAVIMLVVREADADAPERCLLGRSPAWPTGVFSTLAGFVEPGESLEQAVSREVFEEAGIMTADVRYVASQPWPFPRSIMLGFESRATSTDIRVDEHELADARWFTRDELRGFGDWGDGGEGLKLPRSDSIARFLIDRWIDRDDGQRASQVA